MMARGVCCSLLTSETGGQLFIVRYGLSGVASTMLTFILKAGDLICNCL